MFIYEINFTFQMGHSRPLPKTISDSLYTSSISSDVPPGVCKSHEGVLDSSRNIGVVQWAQFIEHDLAKTVQRTMGNYLAICTWLWSHFRVKHQCSNKYMVSCDNSTYIDNHLPIECCAKDFRSAQPRHRHPACAPLLVETTAGRRADIRCLSYVRSALGVDKDCRFGPAKQVSLRKCV